MTAWTPENKCIGKLFTRTTAGDIGREYRNVKSVQVDPKHRGNGVGLALYQALLTHLAPQWKGISSYLPDRINKRQVPKIWRRLGGYVPPDDEDYVLADRRP